MLRPSLPLSVLQVLEHVLLQEWQAPEWVGSWGACGRGQLELKGFPLGLPFREGMSPFLPPPPSPCSDFHPHTPKQVTRAGNNSASLETLPPAFGSLLENQICLQSDITWCGILAGIRCHQVCLCAHLSFVPKQSWKSDVLSFCQISCGKAHWLL